MTRPFRFGVQCKSAASRKEWQELARRIEDLGYSTMTIPDHVDVLGRLEQGRQLRLMVSTAIGHPAPDQVAIQTSPLSAFKTS